MFYMSTHHHDRSVDLALLSRRNMLVGTTTMLLFRIALLTDFVSCVWKLARRSLRRPPSDVWPAAGDDSQPVIVSPANCACVHHLPRKHHKSSNHAIAHYLLRATPPRPTPAADLHASFPTSPPSSSSFISMCASSARAFLHPTRECQSSRRPCCSPPPSPQRHHGKFMARGAGPRVRQGHRLCR